jgi:predicted outer membrane repeat protein
MIRYLLTTILGRSTSAQRKSPPKRRPAFQPSLEALENRWVPSTFTVMNTNDTGDGSLRDIIEHEAVNDGDIVQFDPNLTGQTINLASAITGQASVTIAAPQGSNITIRAAAGSRIFGFDNVGPETINNLTFTGGGPTGNFGGGAIFITGSLTLNNDTFSNNSATSSVATEADGGAIAIFQDPNGPATLTATNTRFTGNSASDGGGAVCGGVWTTLNFTNCSFTSNTASNNGGAIMASTSYNGNSFGMTATDCVFTTNAATNGDGGAIFANGNLTIANSSIVSRFNGNHAGGNGGAVAWEPRSGATTTLSVSTTTFDGNNYAGNGGALYCLANVSAGTTDSITIARSLFNGNSALDGGDGGGIYVENDVHGAGTATVTILNSTFIANSASSDGNGGAIRINNTSDAPNSRNTVNLTSLTVYQNSAGFGGGLYTTTPITALPVVDNCIIAGNTASVAGEDVNGDVAASSQYNLIGSNDHSEGFDNNTNFKGTDANPLSAGLDPDGLGTWGGPTQTIKPVAGSQAIHNGDPTLAGSALLDQRGYNRPAGVQVTIGAYDPDATP